MFVFITADDIPASASDNQSSLPQFSAYPGISIKYDPAKCGIVGNCQFEAIGDQLNTPENIVRQRVVDYMADNACTFSGFHTNVVSE